MGQADRTAGVEGDGRVTAYQDQAKVVIIGGGAIGLSVAYHLAKLGWSDVLLLERNELTSGTSWHAAGIVGPLRASMNLTKLAIYATELFAELEAETGQATGYRRTGGLWLAQNADRITELKRIAAMGTMNGLDARMVTPDETAAAFPLLRVDDLAGALWVAEDGQTNPVDTCMAYAKGARAAGLRIRERTAVTGINIAKGAVESIETADGRRIRCGTLVNCAGAWAGKIGALAGVPVALQAVEHMYVVTEPLADLPKPCPIVRDLESRIYIKEDAGKLVIGGFEPKAKPWMPDSAGPDPAYIMLPEDWEQFEPFMTAGLNRVPALAETGIQHFMNGPESFTPDTRQLMGETPGLRNFFVAAGMNSIGILSSAGVGKALAEWIVGGEAPMDLWEVDVARLEPHCATASFLTARVQEAVANQFEMHWPYKQMKTARGLCRSPLHEAFAAQGAVFGAPTGWERPLWFAATADEAEIRYSYGDQPWWPAAAREAQALQERAALFELSPFTKIEVAGPEAEAFLQGLCANDLAGAPGRLTYSQMLNRRGGIEADVTVQRLAEDRFWVISGAATRQKDLAWLRRHLGDLRAVMTDLTAAYAVLGVMGPESRRLLQAVSSADLSAAAFPFGTCRDIDIGPVRLRAARLSFAGELGWELYIPTESAAGVHATLQQAGAEVGLAPAGHYCLDSCRLEKGFRHWGHDIGPEDTPLEAGLGFALALDKPGGFLGREALLRQRDSGPARHLLHFAVQDAHPLLLHDEPIYRSGKLAGRTTSGGQGFRTGLALCFGSIAAEPGETRKDLLGADYEVAVAGERFPLTPLVRPPYDPDGALMRG